MKTALIIPIHNQRQYWTRMQSAIERLADLPSCVYLMLDRATKRDYDYINNACHVDGLRNSYKVFNIHSIPEYIGRPNNLPDQNLFLTGNRRNHGIDLAIEDGCDCFIFIDGDCLPQPDLIKSHTQANSYGVPNLSVGRRRDQQYNWKDQREVSEHIKPLKLFTRSNELVVQDWDLLTSSTIVWSCNMSLNLSAVNRLNKFNKKYYGRSEVFHSDFLGTWGGEDGFIGIEAYKCNIILTMLGDSKSGINHIHHERPDSKYGGDSFGVYLTDHIELLLYKMKNSPLSADFFSD